MADGIGLELLYEEGPCLVANKPGGLLTQAPPGIDSLEVRLKRFLRDRDGKQGNVYLGLAHRLDRPVSGAIVFAKHARAARRICEQFESRTIRKVYWALVEGRVDSEAGEWRDTMRKVPDEPRAELVSESHPDARHASLRFRVLQRYAATTLLEIELDTGRMHQIRLQSASRGHAVVGDIQYGAAIPFGPATDDPRERWIALHARRLALAHPMTRSPIDIVAPLPEWWVLDET